MPRIRGKTLSVGEAIYQALTGKSARAAEKMSTREKVQEMMQRYESTARVAEKVGVSQRTVQRWLKGTQEAKDTKRSSNATKLNQAHRAARITPGRAAKFKGSATAPAPGIRGSGGLYLFGRIRVSSDVRDRGINPGGHIPQGALDRVIDAMIQGGPGAAEAELNAVLGHYVPGMTVESIEEIDY